MKNWPTGLARATPTRGRPRPVPSRRYADWSGQQPKGPRPPPSRRPRRPRHLQPHPCRRCRQNRTVAMLEVVRRMLDKKKAKAETDLEVYRGLVEKAAREGDLTPADTAKLERAADALGR